MNCIQNRCNNEAVLDHIDGEEVDEFCANCAEYWRYTQAISENGWSQEDCPFYVWREFKR